MGAQTLIPARIIGRTLSLKSRQTCTESKGTAYVGLMRTSRSKGGGETDYKTWQE